MMKICHNFSVVHARLLLFSCLLFLWSCAMPKNKADKIPLEVSSTMPKDIAINYLISELPKISLDDVFPDNGRFLATVDGIELCNHKNRGLCEIVKYSDIQFGYYSTKMKNQSQRFAFMLSNRFKPGFMRWFYMHDGEKSNEIATALATVTHGVWK